MKPLIRSFPTGAGCEQTKNSRQPISYSGVVCRTCRRRGRACDKVRPACGTCKEKGLKCEGYPWRFTGVASRGHLAGQSIPVREKDSKGSAPFPSSSSKGSRKRKAVSRANTRSTTTAIRTDTDTLTEGLDALNMEEGLVLFVLKDPLEDFGKGISSFFKTAYVPAELSHILQYHLEEVNPRLCVDYATTRNPYSEYIMALAFHSPCLLYACAALAASHYYVRKNDDKYHVKSLILKGTAMTFLQRNLEDVEKVKDPSNLSAILMLLLCDMCLGGEYSYEEYFRGAKQLIYLRGAERTKGSFVEQYFAWLDMMSSTSSKRKPLFLHVPKSTPRDATIATIPAQPIVSIDSCPLYSDAFPCPTSQLELLSKVVNLYKSQDDHTNPTTETITEAVRLKNMIYNLQTKNTDSDGWYNISEAYRLSIILFLLRLFRLRDTDEGALEAAQLGSQVLKHIRDTVAGTGYSDKMLWPLLHAGLEIEDKEQQDWLLNRSKQMLESGGFRNVVDVMNILKRVWVARDKKKDYMELVGGNFMIFV